MTPPATKRERLIPDTPESRATLARLPNMEAAAHFACSVGTVRGARTRWGIQAPETGRRRSGGRFTAEGEPLVPLNFRVPASIKARLDAAAASENRAPSEVARTWLESWITCDHVVEEAMRHGACSRLEMEQALEVVARAAVAAGVDYDRRWVAMAVAGVTRQGGESSAAAAGLAAMVEQWPATPWGSLPVWRRGHPRPERFV